MASIKKRLNKLQNESKKTGKVQCQNSEKRFHLNDKCLSEYTPEVLRWLAPNRIPLGKLTLIAGQGGVGKSLIVIDIAAKLSRGWPSFTSDEAIEQLYESGAADYLAPAETLLVSGEDDPSDTLLPRVLACGGDPEKIRVLDSVTDENGKAQSFSLAQVELIDRFLDEHPDVRLVAVDPVTAYLQNVDDHRSTELRAVLGPLCDVSRKHEVAMILLTHKNKNDSKELVHRIIGSEAFVSTVRIAHMVSVDPDDSSILYLTTIKSNVSARDLPSLSYRIEAVAPQLGQVRLQEFTHLSEEDKLGIITNQMLRPIWLGEVDRHEAMREFTSATASSKTSACIDEILHALASSDAGELGTVALSESLKLLLQVSDNTIRRAIQQLRAEGRIIEEYRGFGAEKKRYIMFGAKE